MTKRVFFDFLRVRQRWQVRILPGRSGRKRPGLAAMDFSTARLFRSTLWNESSGEDQTPVKRQRGPQKNRKGRTFSGPALVSCDSMRVSETCLLEVYFLILLRTATRPISPEPRSHAAAGMGTGPGPGGVELPHTWTSLN